MGRFTEFTAWFDATNLYVTWTYDGDTGSLYYVRMRVYEHGPFEDPDSRPRAFYRMDNPPLSHTWVIPISSLRDEYNDSPMSLVPGESWVHISWQSFNWVYGRADAIVTGTQTPEGRFINTMYYEESDGTVWLSYASEGTQIAPRVTIEQYEPGGELSRWSLVGYENTIQGTPYPNLLAGHMAWFRLSSEDGTVLDERYAYFVPHDNPGSEPKPGEEEEGFIDMTQVAWLVGGLAVGTGAILAISASRPRIEKAPAKRRTKSKKGKK